MCRIVEKVQRGVVETVKAIVSLSGKRKREETSLHASLVTNTQPLSPRVPPLSDAPGDQAAVYTDSTRSVRLYKLPANRMRRMSVYHSSSNISIEPAGTILCSPRQPLSSLAKHEISPMVPSPSDESVKGVLVRTKGIPSVIVAERPKKRVRFATFSTVYTFDVGTGTKLRPLPSRCSSSRGVRVHRKRFLLKK